MIAAALGSGSYRAAARIVMLPRHTTPSPPRVRAERGNRGVTPLQEAGVPGANPGSAAW
jgi:hypothetical protein